MRDNFTFTFSDPLGPGNTATVSLDVYNHAPVATDASNSVLHHTTLTGQVYGYDLDGDSTTAQLVSGPEHGTLTLYADGTFSYTPSAGYVGTDSFTFTLSDGPDSSNEGTVYLDIVGNPFPEFGTITVQEGDAVETGLGNLLKLPSISYEAYGLPPDLVLDSQTGMLSGLVSYDAVPEDQQEMAYNVTLTVNVEGLIYSRDFTIVVLARSPWEPVPEADMYARNEQGQVAVTAEQRLLSNDRADPTQQPLRVTDFEPLNGGIWLVEESGALQFSSDGAGQEVFLARYSVSTSSGFTASRGAFALSPFMALKPAYDNLLKYIGNRVANAQAKIAVGEWISDVLNGDPSPTIGGRIGILNAPAVVGPVFGAGLFGGLPKPVEEARAQYAKDNGIPIADVRVDLILHFIYDPPPRRTADVSLQVRLADRGGRAAPLVLPGPFLKQINVPNGPAAGRGYRDYGDH